MNKSRARILSSICTDIAQVLFGAVIAALVLPLDSGKILVVTLEIIFSIICWVLSVLFAEKGRL